MGAVVVFLTVALLVALAALAAAVYVYFDTRAKLDSSSSSAQETMSTVNTLLQNFAKDVDKKFLYYIHDPNQLLNLTDGGLTVKGNPQLAKLGLGTAAVLYDPVAQTLSISQTPNGSKILMTNDYVDLAANGTKVKIGNHFLQSNGASLQLCNSLGVCKTL